MVTAPWRGSTWGTGRQLRGSSGSCLRRAGSDTSSRQLSAPTRSITPRSRIRYGSPFEGREASRTIRLTGSGVEMDVDIRDTDEDYFVHLLMVEAVSCAYSNNPTVQALGDIKALALLGLDANTLRAVEVAFTPEITGERAHRDYFWNVMLPRLESLGADYPRDASAKMAQELKAAAQRQYTFSDLLRDTYRAHPGLNLSVGGPEMMARLDFFRSRVESVLNPSEAKPAGKKSRARTARITTGKPRPKDVSPSTVNPGDRLTVTITGAALKEVTKCTFGGGIKSVRLVKVDSTVVQVKIEVTKKAASGPRTITVTNPDGDAPLSGKCSVV